MIYDDKYDLQAYLDAVEELPESERAPYLNAYTKYLYVYALKNQGYSLADIENKLLRLKRNSKSDGLVETINDFYVELSSDKNGTQELDDLMLEIDRLSTLHGSYATKLRELRYMMALFGVQHNLDCYMFDSNEQVFDDYYHRLLLSKSKGRGR